MPDPLRILLGPAASAALTAAGEHAFAIVGKASHPDDPSRWVILLLPIPKAQADAACRVAMGEARAVHIAAKAPPSDRDPLPRVGDSGRGRDWPFTAHSRAKSRIYPDPAMTATTPSKRPPQRRRRIDPGSSLEQLTARERRELRLSKEVREACDRWLRARGIPTGVAECLQ